MFPVVCCPEAKNGHHYFSGSLTRLKDKQDFKCLPYTPISMGRVTKPPPIQHLCFPWSSHRYFTFPLMPQSWPRVALTIGTSPPCPQCQCRLPHNGENSAPFTPLHLGFPSPPWCSPTLSISVLQMRKMRHSQVKPFVQIYMGSEW